MSGDLLRGAGAGDPSAPSSVGAVMPPSLSESDANTALAGAPADTPDFSADAGKKKRMKRVLGIVLGIVLVLALVGGGVYAYLTFAGGNTGSLVQGAFTQFFEASAFAYNGQSSADLTLSSVGGSGGTNGLIKFRLGYNGKLAAGRGGFSDGTHKLFFDGGWQFGTSTFGTNLESDVIVIGNDFYFNILSIPNESDLDRELLRANWVQMNFAEIAREFQLSGSVQGEEEYGAFGGTTGDTSLHALLANSFGFTALGDPVQDDAGGTPHLRIEGRLDAERFAELIRTLYRKYFNRNFTLSEDEALRFRGALEKLTATVWIEEESGVLAKITLSGTLDDDIGATHVAGPVLLEFTFAEFNKPPLFGTPAPILSLQELRAQMETVAGEKGVQAVDDVRVGHVARLVEALALYKKEKGRYPKELTELYGAKKLTESTIDLATLRDYLYRSYVKADDLSKTGACLTTGKNCAFYHLGTSLLNAKHRVLQSDADKTTAILGSDKAGCAGEANRYCYDVVSPSESQTTSTAPSVSPVTSATAPKPSTSASSGTTGAQPSSSSGSSIPSIAF